MRIYNAAMKIKTLLSIQLVTGKSLLLRVSRLFGNTPELKRLVTLVTKLKARVLGQKWAHL